ncbi:MAG: hypothetical protein QME79_02565 [Bacillota bacterium]|nr:hypothetical protein [Bacillota bacterium]
MRRFGGIEIRNLTSGNYGFPVEAMIAQLLADVPAGDLRGLYQVALLDSSRGRVTDRTRWVGVYSNRDGRHALIELYLEPILGTGASRLDRWTGYLLSRLRLGQALFHQIGVHRQRIAGRSWLFGPELYSRYLLLRVFNPAKLLLYFPERILRRWRKELRDQGFLDSAPRGGGGRRDTRMGGLK